MHKSKINHDQWQRGTKAARSDDVFLEAWGVVLGVVLSAHV